MARLAADIDTRSFSLLCIAHWQSGRPTAPKVLGSSPMGEKNQLLCTGNHRMICMHWYSLLFLIIDQRFIDIANFKVSLMFFSQKRNGDNDNGRKSNMNLYYLRPLHPPLSREMSTDKWKEIENIYIPPFSSFNVCQKSSVFVLNFLRM